jgi:hypothetical protein
VGAEVNTRQPHWEDVGEAGNETKVNPRPAAWVAREPLVRASSGRENRIFNY